MNCFKDFDDSLIITILPLIKKNGKIVKRQYFNLNPTFRK